MDSVLDYRQERALKLLGSLQQLTSAKEDCDFEIRISGQALPAHRLILSASSDYFRAMFRHNMKEAQQGYVHIKNLEYEAVKSCIDYLYSGQIAVTKVEDMEETLRACDLLQINDLKEIILRYFSQNVATKTCLSMFFCGITYYSEILKRAAEECLSKNFNVVTKSFEWKRLEIEQLCKCLEVVQDKPTADKWRSIVGWVCFDISERSSQVSSLLMYINPIDLECAVTVLVTHPLIGQTEESVHFLMTEIIQPNLEEVGKLIDEDNCFELKSWAKFYACEALNTSVDTFMSKHFKFITDSPRFQELEFDDFENIMKKAQNVSEEMKLQAVINFIRQNPEEKSKFVQLFRQIDLTKMAADFINDSVRNQSIVQESNECKEMILDAMYSHTKRRMTNPA